MLLNLDVAMFGSDVQSEDVFVFWGVVAVAALELRFHAANVVHVPPQIVDSSEGVATFRTIQSLEASPA